MKATENEPASPEILAELEAVLRNPYAAPDPKGMAKACRQINRMREETQRKTGELAVAVDLIRYARR